MKHLSKKQREEEKKKREERERVRAVMEKKRKSQPEGESEQSSGGTPETSQVYSEAPAGVRTQEPTRVVSGCDLGTLHPHPFLGGVQTQELSPYIPTHPSIPSDSGGVHAPLQAPEAPVSAHVPPSSVPTHSSVSSQQQSTHHISSQGCAHRTPGGVPTQERSQGVSGLRLRNVPPSTSPTLRKGPPSDSHGHMDVDMEMGDQAPVRHHTHHPRQGTPSRRRGLGSWRAQLKRRHSSSGVREEHQAKRRHMADERFLATATLLQALSISHPSRPRSAAQSPRRTGTDAVQRYNRLLERMRTDPHPFIEVETHRQGPSHTDIPPDHAHHASHQAVDPLSQSQANEQPYAEFNMLGRTIRVSYPVGYQINNPNATLRQRTVIYWPAIANLMVDLHAWYDDRAVWLYVSNCNVQWPTRNYCFPILYRSLAPNSA